MFLQVMINNVGDVFSRFCVFQCIFRLVLVTLALSRIISKIWPFFHWKTHIFPTSLHSAPKLKMFLLL